MKRSEFNRNLLKTVVGYFLLESLFNTQAFSSSIKPIAKHWAIELQTYCNDLKKNSITPGEWQKQIHKLYQTIELSELLKFIDFEKVVSHFNYPDLGVHTRPVKFPKLEGLPDQTVFVKKIFGMKKDRAIIPHGHSNMASAHLVLKGDMHLRHYEKLGKEDNTLIIKPSLDKTISVGGHSSISDERDNVHWFIAQSESAFTFDVIMLDLNNKHYDIHNIDIYAKQDLANGTMRVPIMDVDTALKKYGKATHH